MDVFTLIYDAPSEAFYVRPERAHDDLPLNYADSSVVGPHDLSSIADGRITNYVDGMIVRFEAARLRKCARIDGLHLVKIGRDGNEILRPLTTP